MKKVIFQPSFLKILYLLIYAVLFFLIVFIPKLIHGPLNVSEKLILEEELIEGSLLGVLFLINILIMYLYKSEAIKQKKIIETIKEGKKSAEDKLIDSFKYIGQINVQIQQINSIFNNMNKFPETKNDLKKALLFFSGRVFGIVNSEWVLFRIIDCNTQKTLGEQFETRNGFSARYPHISNKMIIEDHTCHPLSAIISNPPNLNILTCCIIPNDTITSEEQVFIQAITNEITTMFVLYNSSHYRNSGVIIPKGKTEKSVNSLICNTQSI